MRTVRFWHMPAGSQRAGRCGIDRPNDAQPSSDAAAEVSGLGVRRGRVEALRGVDLTVRAGETIALMGRNGAGKSTLLTTLVGMVEPAVRHRPRRRAARRTAPRPASSSAHVGLVPQEPRDLLYADTVAAECAAADADAGAAAGTCRALVVRAAARRPGRHPPPRPVRGPAARPRPGGRAHRPPAAAPPRRADPRPRLRGQGPPGRRPAQALAAEGHAIVLATHDVELAAELAHRVVILADGEIVADGPTAEVVVSSPSFAPQVAKILAPQQWLTVAQVATPWRPA